MRRTDVPPSIVWRCTSCGDEGVISGWDESPYDLRRRRPVAVPAKTRLIFCAQAADDGAVLIGDDDAFDELLGYVAAEANHEANRRRQRRLDEAFQLLNGVIEAQP